MEKKITIVMGLVMLGTISAAEAQDVFYDVHLAQGDGDPEEMAVVEKAASEEEMALVTPEGDFLVPTFLLPTVPSAVHENALAPKAEDEVSQDNNVLQEQQKQGGKPVLTQETGTDENVVEKKISPEDTNISSQTKSETDVAEQKTSEVETNIQENEKESSPVKEDIVQSENKQENGSPVDEENRIIAEPRTVETPQTNSMSSEEEGQKESSASLFEENDNMQFNLKTRPKRKPETTPTPPPRVRQLIPFDYADTALESFMGKTRLSFKMPKEMKVVFYPNATDISGQTMKWIRVFALQALRDARLQVNMRVSTQSPAVQQARIGLITRMLQDQGLTAHQIQISYTDRDVNSLILSLRNNELETQNLTTKKRFGKVETKKIQQW